MVVPHHVRMLLRASAASIAVMMLLAGIASAHEHREVEGYAFTVGFLVEPAVANEVNGLSLRIEAAGEEDHDEGEEADHEEGAGVEGLDATLQAEVIYGEETRALELRPAFGDPGHYQAEFIPTEAGTYSFRIFGAIDGVEVDETFTGGPDTFSEVEARDGLFFPAGAASNAASSVTDAQDTADTAQTLGIIGLIIGVLAMIVAVVAVVMSRRPPATSATASTTSD